MKIKFLNSWHSRPSGGKKKQSKSADSSTFYSSIDQSIDQSNERSLNQSIDHTLLNVDYLSGQKNAPAMMSVTCSMDKGTNCSCPSDLARKTANKCLHYNGIKISTLSSTLMAWLISLERSVDWLICSVHNLTSIWFSLSNTAKKGGVGINNFCKNRQKAYLALRKSRNSKSSASPAGWKFPRRPSLLGTLFDWPAPHNRKHASDRLNPVLGLWGREK